MVDNPPADELHSPPRRVTCNARTLVSGEQAYKNMMTMVMMMMMMMIPIMMTMIMIIGLFRDS